VPAARCMRRDSGGRSYVARCGIRAAYRGLAGVAFRALCVERGASHCRARWERRGVASAERAACCTCAQGYDHKGGVVRMDKGSVLFDGVAISGTEAGVRIGGQRCVSEPMHVGGARRMRVWMAAAADVARPCAGGRRGLDERRGGHVQGRHEHQRQGVGGRLQFSASLVLWCD
jgi:hypothetical protein